MPDVAATNLEHQIRSQPDALAALLGSADVRRQVHEAAEGLHRARRLWVVGTGTSLHAAELGASLIQLSGRQAHAVPAMEFVDFAPLVGPQDGIVVITHTAETAFALSTRAQAFSAGLGPVLITKRGSGFPDAIETVDKETSETYTVSFTTAVLAVALLARALGAENLDDATLSRVPVAVAAAIADPSIDAIARPERVLVFVGAGPSAVTAREGALKVREASRSLAEGYDAEYLLHGSAVPLDARDGVVALFPPDPSGLVEAVARAAEAERVHVTRLTEPADLPQTLAQLPLTVRLQLMALRFARERSQDPDTVIVGAWNDPATWAIGAP
jgi:glucosamine--fructose-6-phosphate aminotransferase (isomerizing)